METNKNIEYKAIKVKTITFSFTDEKIKPVVIEAVGLSEDTLETIMNILKESVNEVKH